MATSTTWAQAQALREGGRFLHQAKGGKIAGVTAAKKMVHKLQSSAHLRSSVHHYQRLTHYGINGFGTVASFTKAWELDDDQTRLKAAVIEMYNAEEPIERIATVRCKRK